MEKTELKNCPEWLMLAHTENEDVSYGAWGQVIWNGGNFLCGDFLGGDFLGGHFRGGDFLGGNFRGGDFRGGDFLGGDFLGGDFRGGDFRGGDFLGGDFLGGDFIGGNFLGGNFLGGVMLPHCKWIYGQDCDGNIIIGCKRMAIEKWEEWFNGEEELETKRGTEDFKKIQACFEATKAFINFLKK